VRQSLTILAVAIALSVGPLGNTQAVFGHPLPGAPNCPVFPAASPWNQRIDAAPVAAGSGYMLQRMGLTRLHADFSDSDADGYGIPFNVIDAATPQVSVTFDYADESDRSPYQIPNHPRVENGSDSHLITINADTCELSELFDAHKGAKGWSAGSGARWALGSLALRPEGWTSADAAGLPIFPGLARFDEIARGSIDHALRFTMPLTQRAYLWPARHFASNVTSPWAPPMGLRVRIRSDFDLSSFDAQSRVVLTAIKRYGLILADNGSAGFVSGAPDVGWNDDDLHDLQSVPASAFEVVDTSALPGTPHSRLLNRHVSVSRTSANASAFHTRRGRLTFQALRGGHIVKAVHARAGQGYVRMHMRAVVGATYRFTVG